MLTQPLILSGTQMSTSQNVIMLCSWAVKVGMAHSFCQSTCGWQVKLCDPSLTRVIPGRFRDDIAFSGGLCGITVERSLAIEKVAVRILAGPLQNNSLSQTV